MDNLHKDRLEEAFADASLMLLMDDFAQCHGEMLLEEYRRAETAMPDALDRVCREKIASVQKKSEKDILLRRTARRAAKAAVITLVSLCLCANLVLSVEALRVPFLNLCIQARKHFSSLTFSTENSGSYGSDKDVVELPIPAPEGYNIVVKDHNHDGYAYIYPDSVLFLGYQDPEGHLFTFQTLPANGSFTIDTEDAESTEFLLNGMQAIQIRQEDDNFLRTIWIDPQRQRLFDISCNGMAEEDFQELLRQMSAMLMAPEFYAD